MAGGFERASSSSPTPPPSPGGRRGSPLPAPTLTPKSVLISASGIGRRWHGLRQREGQSLPAAIIQKGTIPLARASLGCPPLPLHPPPDDMADDHSAQSRTIISKDVAPAAASEITPAAAEAAGVAGPAVAAGAAALRPPGTPRSYVTQLIKQASASEFEVVFNLTGEGD